MKISNIIFSNGELDPWHAGGVLTTINSQSISLVIADAAHHLDLRLPNAADPESVTQARQIETEWIAKWIDQY
jgi:lysosomal Pro-X carboxypeptidase